MGEVFNLPLGKIMVDKVKPLKMEDSTSGTEVDYLPTETDPSEDYLACKGIALENSETTQIWKEGNDLKFKDPTAGTKTLTDLTGGGGGTDTDAIHDNVAGEIAAISEKTAPEGDDLLIIEDSSDSNNKKKIKVENLPKNIDGGSSSSAYLSSQNIDGGNASAVGDVIQVRRDTAANWTSSNPTLAQGEWGEETDTKKLKRGDGSTAWNSLGYVDANYLHTNVAGEINSLSEKSSPVDADMVVIEDSADSNNKKKVQLGNLFAGSDTNAIHDNVAGEIAAISEKVSPVSADLVIIEDSADSNNKKKVQVGNIGGGGGAFGSGYTYSESLSEQSTTSSVYMTATTHVNSNPNAGETYAVIISGEFKSDGSCTCQAKGYQQSGDTIFEVENSTNEYRSFMGILDVSSFFLGKVQVPLVFRRSAGTGTVYVRNIRIESFRVS